MPILLIHTAFFEFCLLLFVTNQGKSVCLSEDGLLHYYAQWTTLVKIILFTFSGTHSLVKVFQKVVRS